MADAHAPLAGLKVLIVEDTWHTAMVIQQTLLTAGASVVGVAGNLQDAEACSRDLDCNVVVMDLNMDGQRADQLASDLAGRGLGVVVVSGYRRPADLAAPLLAFLQKPTEPEKLVAVLAEAARTINGKA